MEKPKIALPIKILLFTMLALLFMAVADILFISSVSSQLVLDARVWLAIAAALIAIPIWLATRAQIKQQNASAGILKRGFLAVGIPVMFFLFAYMGFVKGIPSIYTLVAGAEGSRLVTVEHKNTRSKGCSNGVKFAEGGMFSDQVCGIAKDFQDRLEVGEPMCIHGSKTGLAIIPKTVSLPVNHDCPPI